MKQLKQLLLVMAIALTGITPAQAQTPWTHYSEWMANTQKSYVYQKSSGNDYWRYDDGLMYESILDTYEHYKNGNSDIGDATLKNAVKSYIDNCVNSSGSITNYESTTLDDIRPARMVYKYFKLYGGENLKTACRTVLNCNAFKDDVRVISQSTGYPWQHKGDYAHQVWLDGIFMGLPYWTLAGPDTEITSTIHGSWTANDYFDDAVSQMQITDEKTYEPTNGLWCHAWDATSPISFFWATKTGGFLTNEFKSKHSPYELVAHNGRSSHCWGRALGWFAMAIMETMDNIAKVNGASDSRITTLKALFKKVMDKVVETRDPSEGVWHCVIDVDATQAPYSGYSNKNNYLEATCSAMFTYCLLHGVAQKYLDSSYLPIAKDAYNKFITKFIDDTGTNLIMSNCMSVGGLDNDKKGNTKRDGSYAYYMSESIVENDSKGVGPFIWASLEAEKTYGYTIGVGFSKKVESNDLVQFRWSRVADDFTVPGTTPSSFVSPTFTAKTSGGTTLSNSSNITFSSDNEAVATVDDNGTITLAGEEGTANIKATMKSDAYVYAGEAIYTVTTTGTDTTKPTLSSSTPATGATDVAVSGNITLTFSENVTINNASEITLTGGSGTLDTASATVDGATITIPYSGLANSTDYTLNIAAGAFEDLSNNTNDAISAITFRTIAPDLTAPTLSNQSISDGATNVSTSGSIVLTFSEAVTCSTNATLTTTGSSAINLTPTVSGSTVTYSYSGLSNSTSYTFNLADNSVTDLAGNKYASAINFGFTTGAAPVNNTYSFGFNQDILDSYDSNGTLLSNPSHDGTVIDISSYGSSAALACGDAYVTSTSTKENCVSISNNASENYNQHYVEIHSTEDIKSIYLVAAVTGSTDASSAVAVGWTGTPSATISEYHTFTTPGKGSTSGHEITINFPTSGIKYVRLYRKIKLDSATKTTFQSNSSTTIPSSASTYGIAFIKVTTQTGSTPTPSKVANPVITGDTPFSSSTTATITCETTGATIHYTTDGSVPTSSSATYSEPINISASTTVKAIAVKEGMTNSEVASKTFTQDNTAPTVTMTTPSATTNVAINTSSVVLTVSEEVTAVGEDIAGTFNDSAITFTRTDATHLTYNLPDLTNNTTYNIQLNANQIQDAAGNKNAETSFSFTTVAAEQEQVATPSISGTTPFTESTTATITCTTTGATIHYTTDGSTPTASSATYSSPIAISATTTVKAIAVKTGMTDSEVATQTFTKSSGGGETTSATITIGNSKSTSYAATFSSSSTNEHITASATAFTTGSSMATSNSTNNSATAPYSIKYKPSDNINTSEYSDAYSVSAQFTVANGYTFTPTAISTTIVTEAANYTYQAVLTDGTTTYTSNDISSSNNGVSTFSFPSLSGTALSGTVTYKIRFKSTATNSKFFVINLPITISGTVSSSSTPPTPTYTVTATSNNISWGTVSVDKATAAEDATVTITTSPASGYELTSLTATDGDSNPVTITNNQFTMPASNVTVNATFAALPPVLGAVTFSPAGGNYSSEQNVTISATNAEEIWYSTVSQAAAVKNGANATQYTSAIHIGEGSTTLYATAYLGESTTTGSATYTVTIPDVGNGTKLYTFSMSSGSTINFANGDKENFSLINDKSCEINNSNIKFRWHKDANTYGKFTLTSKIPIQSVRLVGTIEGGSQEYQDVTVTPNGTYDSETMTWTANSDNVTSVTFTNNYSTSSNGNILISKIIVVYYAPETITIAEAGFSTFYKTYAVSVGDGGTAYYVSDIRNKNVVLTPFDNNIIPANTGAVIKGTFGDEVTLNRAIADDFTATNFLLGTDTKQNITADKDSYYYFISGRQKQADNSYKYGWLVPYALKTTSVFSNNANKAYLRVPKAMLDNETSARMLTLIWEDYEQPIATGIDGFATDNGFIVIDDNTPLYNLSGQRVSKSYKGIVIINGKKVLRK